MFSRTRPAKVQAADESLRGRAFSDDQMKYVAPPWPPVSQDYLVEDGDNAQVARMEEGVETNIVSEATVASAPTALPELLQTRSYDERPTFDKGAREAESEADQLFSGVTLETIAKLRDEHVDYFVVEDFVKRVVTDGTNHDVLLLLDFSFIKLILYEDVVTEVEKARWATRMMEVYTAAADAIMTEPNVEVREELVAGPLTRHVLGLAEDSRLLTRLVNRRLPERLLERFVSTRIFRSVLQVKYNAPACWLTFSWSFARFSIAVVAYSIVVYQLGPGSADSLVGPDSRGSRNALRVLLGYIGLSGLGGLVVELFRIFRIHSNEMAGMEDDDQHPGSLSRTVLGLPRAWRCDLWHWVDLSASLVLFGVSAWALAIWSRSGHPPSLHEVGAVSDDFPEDRRHSPPFSNFVAFGTLILWIKILAFLKGIGLKYAAFVQMLVKIVQDLKQFVVVLAVIFLAFTQVFYIRLGPIPSRDLLDDGAPSPFRTFPRTLQAMYLLAFMGDFEPDTYPRTVDKCLLFVFIFVVIIVMLNVLIAIVCDSYNYAMATSVQLFWRSRLEVMYEYENKESLDSLLCRLLQPFSVSRESTLSVLKAELLDEEGDGGPQSETKVGRVLDIVTRVEEHVNSEFIRLKRAMFVELQELGMKLEMVGVHVGATRSTSTTPGRGGKPTRLPTGAARKMPSRNMFNLIDPRVARAVLFGSCCAPALKRREARSPPLSFPHPSPQHFRLTRASIPPQHMPDIVESRLTRASIRRTSSYDSRDGAPGVSTTPTATSLATPVPYPPHCASRRHTYS